MCVCHNMKYFDSSNTSEAQSNIYIYLNYYLQQGFQFSESLKLNYCTVPFVSTGIVTALRINPKITEVFF